MDWSLKDQLNIFLGIGNYVVTISQVEQEISKPRFWFLTIYQMSLLRKGFHSFLLPYFSLILKA